MNRIGIMEQELQNTDELNGNTEEISIAENTDKKYNIIKELKNNDYGKTLLAATKDTGDFFVIKHIKAVDLAYASLSKIIDTTLPKVVFCQEDKEHGETTVVEEYINGQTLTEWMEKRELEPIGDALAKNIFRQLANGLKTLHDNNIMHRGISPDNIMIAGGDVKFVGLSHAVIGKTYDDVPEYKGKLGFAPPEQEVLGKADYRSDIYSLGMTMQSLLGADYKGKYKKIVKHMLAIDPDERYQNGDQLKKAVQNAGMLSLRKIIIGVAALYILVLAGLWVINTWFNPVKKMEAQNKFEQEQSQAQTEAKNIAFNKAMGNVGDGSADGSQAQYSDGDNQMAKGKLAVSVAFPGRPQEKGNNAVIINMGKVSELSGADNAQGDEPVTFPDNAKLEVTIKNNTTSDIKNPVIRFVPYYIDLSNIKDTPNTITKHLAGAVECQRDINIPAGGEEKFTLSLKNAVLLYPKKENTMLKVIVRSDNYPNTGENIKFSFR